MRIGDFHASYRHDEALFDTRVQRAWFAVLIVALLAFPFVGGAYFVYLACLLGIHLISAAGLNIMTGYSAGNLLQLRPEPTDPPDIGAICQYLKMAPADMPGAVCLPCDPGWGERSMYPG